MDDMARSKPVFLHENGYQFEQYIKQAIEAVMLSNEKSEVALADLRRNLQEVLDEE
jgi:multiple sugar transport system substrate-binding protein